MECIKKIWELTLGKKKPIETKNHEYYSYYKKKDEDYYKAIKEGVLALVAGKEIVIAPTERAFELALEIKKEYIKFLTRKYANTIEVNHLTGGKIGINISRNYKDIKPYEDE